MKRFPFFIALLLLPNAASATITVTARCVNGSTTSGNTIACSLTGSTTTGNLIAVQIARNSSTETISSVSDGGTNTFVATTGSPCTKSAGTARRTWVYYAKNATGVTNATWTVTFGSTNTNYRKIVVSEISGVSTTAPLDKETCASATSSSVPDPGSTTLSFNNEAILEDSTVSASDTVGSTFTSLGINSGNQAQFKVVTGGAWGVSAFATANTDWIAKAATFTDAVASGGAPHQLTTIGCCGMAMTVDDDNFFGFAGCVATDSGCQQGIAVCSGAPGSAEENCVELPLSESALRVKLWRRTPDQTLYAPVAQLVAADTAGQIAVRLFTGAPLP